MFWALNPNVSEIERPVNPTTITMSVGQTARFSATKRSAQHTHAGWVAADSLNQAPRLPAKASTSCCSARTRIKN